LWEHLGVDPKDDPEARIRELERSLGDVASTSELTAPTTRTTAGARGSRIVVVAVAVGLAALAAGVAFVVARHSDGRSSTSVSSTRVHGSRPSISTTTATPAIQPLQRLYAVLPRAYTSNNCSPADSPNSQALATVECKKTSDPDSPTYAAFSLYPSAAALDKAFNDGVTEDTVTPCPHGGDSPGSWHTQAAPKVTSGSVLCGTYNNGPDLLWTQNKELLIGDIQGPDLNALYRFWQDL
jgi:serine/threonine kinase PknH